MQPKTLPGVERALRALSPAMIDPPAIPPLAPVEPPSISVEMPDGSTVQIPGAEWPQPDVWAASERRAVLGEPPSVQIRRLTRKEANQLAADWDPLGTETRPVGYHAFALFVAREPLALATAGSADSAIVDRSLGLRPEHCVELTRLYRSPQAEADGGLRVMLRLWRDFLAIPYLPYYEQVEKVALISYSMPGKDGDLYRHDGWQRVRACKRSGGGRTWSRLSRLGSRGPEALWVYWLPRKTAASDAVRRRTSAEQPVWLVRASSTTADTGEPAPRTAPALDGSPQQRMAA